MTTRDLNQLIEVGSSLKMIAQSYGELASIKLKRIRSRVEQNRRFYDELTQVYGVVNAIALTRGVTSISKPKKSISVLLTSNYHFYGNINNNLVKYFIIQNTKIHADKLVIGKTGRDYLKSIRYFHPFEIVFFKNDLPNDNELKDLIVKLQQYEQVLVFYPEFKSVLIQQPILRDITQAQVASLQKQTSSQTTNIKMITSQKEFRESSFIFEPEILKMLDFFDRQVKILLFEQILLESELSRTASRIIAMDQAQNNANDFIKDQRKVLAQLKKSALNSQILETIIGMSTLKLKKVRHLIS